MESLSNDSNWSDESMIGLPLEVNVVIKKPENIVSSACVTNDTRTDKTDIIYTAKGGKNDLTSNTNDRRPHKSVHHNYDFKRRESDESVAVIYVRENEPDLTLSYEKEIQDHAKISLTRTDLIQKHGLDNVVIDLESTTTMKANNANQCNEFDVGMPDQIENNTSRKASQSIVPDVIIYEDENASSEEVKKNETANKFLNELYDKKLKLENKFSDQEIKDICEAVLKHVKMLAKSIGEIDLRLTLKEVIPVGSAREDTQIIRPCEYDFILILDVLSKPGVVSITPARVDQFGSLSFMNVKVEDNDVRSMFQNFIENNYLRGSHWLPFCQPGLRQVFSSAVYQAVRLNSRTSIKMSTGILKSRCSKPETHGPAFMIGLIWERKTIEKYLTMEISVDLCPAIKLDLCPAVKDYLDPYYSNMLEYILPSFVPSYYYELDFIERIDSFLLMPHIGHQFKVTFTETLTIVYVSFIPSSSKMLQTS